MKWSFIAVRSRRRRSHSSHGSLVSGYPMPRHVAGRSPTTELPWNVDLPTSGMTRHSRFESLQTMPNLHSRPNYHPRPNGPNRRPGRVTLALQFDNGLTQQPPAATTLASTKTPEVELVAADASTGKALPVVAEPEFGWLRVRLDGITKEGDDLNSCRASAPAVAKSDRHRTACAAVFREDRGPADHRHVGDPA